MAGAAAFRAWNRKGGSTVVKAQVPLAEMLTYASDLTSMTQGRGTYCHGNVPL